jgi:hypothetical protein
LLNVPAGTETESVPTALQSTLETIWESMDRVLVTTVPLIVTVSDQVSPVLKVLGIL